MLTVTPIYIVTTARCKVCKPVSYDRYAGCDMQPLTTGFQSLSAQVHHHNTANIEKDYTYRIRRTRFLLSRSRLMHTNTCHSITTG